MIVTNLSPLGITWGAAIDNVPFSKQSVQKIHMSFAENQHDVATIEVVGIPSVYLSTYIERPISLYIRINGGKVCNFYGYISHIEGVSSTNEGVVNNSAFQLLKIICIGSSHVLRSNNTLVWENVTLENIVSEVCDEFRLAYSIPNDSYVFKRLVQSEESLWKLLVKMCDQLGYNVTLSNAHIHVWDKDKSLARQPSFTTLRGLKVKKTDYSPLPGDIISLESTLGAASVVDQYGDKSVSYIDERGLLVTVDSAQLDEQSTFGTPKTSRFSNKFAASVDSFEKASKVLQARIKKARPYTATALVYGDPSIMPGGVVKIEGYDGDFDGYWYVHTVSHELQSELLVTEVRLEKDGSYDELPRFPVVQKYVNPPTPVLINDAWVMQSEYVNVYN